MLVYTKNNVHNSFVQTSKPLFRKIKAYSFDPGYSSQFDMALLNQYVYRISWEDAFIVEQEAWMSRMLMIKDKCCDGYLIKPIDLNHIFLLAQDGYVPHRWNLNFHQQMLYAVISNTIINFRKALGRPVNWISTDQRHKFIRNLQVRPHEPHEIDAHCDPRIPVLKFGYHEHFHDIKLTRPVYTCLSADMIAHETTHAILIGMKRFVVDEVHPDHFAFQEAMADLVSLFQHFTYKEDIIKDQINKSNNDLRRDNVLIRFAYEVGRARGKEGPLRYATKPKNIKKLEKKARPDHTLYQTEKESHKRGSILVGAVFEAFLTCYERRAAPFFKMSQTDPAKERMPPDLVDILAKLTRKTAKHFLAMIIRALDYCPPVYITFPEFLTAIITSDTDLYPEDKHLYRTSLIRSFEYWGIVPRQYPDRYLLNDQRTVQNDIRPNELALKLRELHLSAERYSRKQLDKKINKLKKLVVRTIWEEIEAGYENVITYEKMTGLILCENKAEKLKIVKDEDGKPKLEVKYINISDRIGSDMNREEHAIIGIIQERKVNNMIVEGGCNLLIDLKSSQIQYCIIRPLLNEDELKKQIDYFQNRSFYI